MMETSTTPNDLLPAAKLIASATNPMPPQRKRTRRNSGALMEERPPDWASNSVILRKIHDFVYPPGSKWYWYRRGKIGHSSLSTKYWKLAMGMFLMALTGSGYFFPIVLIMYSACARQVYQLHEYGAMQQGFFEGLNATDIATSVERPEWHVLAQQWWFIALQCFASGVVTCLVYALNGMYLINTYYVQRKDDPENWKCQPDSYLTPERWREEKILGTTNAFVAGVFGTGLYFLHLNHPFLKLYYETGTRGFFQFFGSAIFCYLWIDFYSYWAHRFLHTRFMYRNVHKVHHRYVHPTPFSAFALHPIEFLVFQSAGIIQAAFVPMHIIGYLVVVLFVAFHNQVDHSGIDFEGDLPWMPTTKYHDDHHLYFHLNFGLHLVFWDWLGGTLRSKERQYGEDMFVGEQDVVGKTVKVTTDRTATSAKKEE